MHNHRVNYRHEYEKTFHERDRDRQEEKVKPQITCETLQPVSSEACIHGEY